MQSGLRQVLTSSPHNLHCFSHESLGPAGPVGAAVLGGADPSAPSVGGAVVADPSAPSGGAAGADPSALGLESVFFVLVVEVLEPLYAMGQLVAAFVVAAAAAAAAAAFA